MSDIVQYLLSFAGVIGSLLGLLWLLKRWQNQGGWRKRTGADHIEIIETASLGARQKVVLVRFDQQLVLLGVTPSEIRPLHVGTQAPKSTEEWLRRRQP